MNEKTEPIGQCYSCKHCSENGLNALYCTLRLLKGVLDQSNASVIIIRQMQAMQNCQHYDKKD